jgi:hypothetical protein
VWKTSIQKILSAFVRLGHSELASLTAESERHGMVFLPLSITFLMRISVN